MRERGADAGDSGDDARERGADARRAIEPSMHRADWNWQNPFTAYNCTWGFHYPTPYPESADAPCADGAAGVALPERNDSTTWPPTARTPPSIPMATSAQCRLTAWHCSARISHCIQCPLTAWHCVHCRCPRAMLCDWNTLKEGGENGKRISRCNLEGYGGLDYETFGGDVSHVLDGLPEKRCPYPPMDVPGPGAGFDANGHWTGRGTARVA
jgi:hypothetical protein